jgi:hypothetical protein
VKSFLRVWILVDFFAHPGFMVKSFNLLVNTSLTYSDILKMPFSVFEKFQEFLDEMMREIDKIGK